MFLILEMTVQGVMVPISSGNRRSCIVITTLFSQRQSFLPRQRDAAVMML